MSIFDQVSDPNFQSTLAGYTSPQIGTPSASSLDSGGSSGGLFSSIGPSLQGVSNIGLQWFTAVSKGVSSPLVVPQPVQATPAAAAANVLNQVTSYLPLVILVIAVIVGLYVVKNRRKGG